MFNRDPNPDPGIELTRRLPIAPGLGAGPLPRRDGVGPADAFEPGFRAGYRRWRDSLRASVRSSGGWTLVAVAMVVASAGGIANWVVVAVAAVTGLGGRGVQAAAAAGPDWGVLQAIAGLPYPWMLTGLPVLAWLVWIAATD